MGHGEEKGEGSRAGFLELWKQRPGSHYTDGAENEMGEGSNKNKTEVQLWEVFNSS